MKSGSLFVLIFLIVGSTLLQSCASTQVARFSSDKDDLPVYSATVPDRPFTETVYFETTGSILHSKKALMRTLKRKAKKENVDALIKVRFYYIPHLLTGLPAVEAVGVNYK